MALVKMTQVSAARLCLENIQTNYELDNNETCSQIIVQYTYDRRVSSISKETYLLRVLELLVSSYQLTIELQNGT